MNKEQNNNQDSPVEPTSGEQENSCADCKKDSCVCPNRNDDSSNKTGSEQTPSRTKLPKISWI